jgi:hypothetical protein
MPNLTLMLDGKPLQVYDLDQAVIRIGRSQGMDVLIDNVSVSRRQAEIRREGTAWVVRDLGSSSGTFVNGEKLAGDRALQAGDEISFGKFSLFFERVGAPPAAREAAAVASRPSPPPITGDPDATRHLIGRPLLMSGDELDQLQQAASQRRQAPGPAKPAVARVAQDPGRGAAAARPASAPGLRQTPWWRGWLRVTVAVYAVAVLAAWIWDIRGVGRDSGLILEHLSPRFAATGVLPDRHWCVLVAAPDFLALPPRDRERRAEAFFDREIAPLLEALSYRREPFRTQFVRAAGLDVDTMPIRTWRQDSAVHRREQPYRDVSEHAMPQRDHLRQATAASVLALVWGTAVLVPVVAIASAGRWIVQRLRPDARRPY